MKKLLALVLAAALLLTGCHGIGAVRTANLLYHCLGCGLVIGNDRQCLQLRGRKLGRLSGFQGLCDVIRHFSGGYHLIALFQL